MNQIERLRDMLARRFPALAPAVDAPDQADGPWFLDVRRGEGVPPVVVEWRPDRGFGVSTPGGDDYGSGPDEVYPNARAAFERVARLVLSGGKTEPPRAVGLAELRRLLGLSQEELAARAGVKQANVSRIEKRGDILLSSLGRLVGAMGCSVTMRVQLPGGAERTLLVPGTGGLGTDARAVVVQGQAGKALPGRKKRPARPKAVKGKKGTNPGGSRRPATS